MKNKTQIIVLILLISIQLACGIIPHYKEKRQDTKSNSYEGYSFEKIWDAVIKSIMDMEYVLKNMDKDSGFINAAGEGDALSYPYRSFKPTLNVIIKNIDERVTVTCQVYTGISIDSEKVMNKFFSLFQKYLDKH